MPSTVNGFGTSICGARGDVGWGSFDALECVVALGMPIIPYKCVHTFDWRGNQYRAIPIRWSSGLALRVYVGHWLWAAVIIGVILGIVAFVSAGKSPASLLLLIPAVILIGLGILTRVLLYVSDKRNKNIRRVLGAITVGNCDPAHFTEDMLEKAVGNPRLAYGTETFAEAVEVLLEKRSYAQAMWAARLCVAVEDPTEGEALTDRILEDADVQHAIEQVRQNGECWSRVMGQEDEREESPRPARRSRDDDQEDERPRQRRERRDEDEDRPSRRERDRRRPRDDEEY